MIRYTGFSLLELLITVVMVIILASISYPSYLRYVTKVRRTEACTHLYGLALQLEQYYTEHYSYKGASLAELGVSNYTENGYYTLKLIIQDNGSSYLATAAPQGIQAKQDPNCGTLSLDALGKKGISGPGPLAECWH